MKLKPIHRYQKDRCLLSKGYEYPRGISIRKKDKVVYPKGATKGKALSRYNRAVLPEAIIGRKANG